MNALRENEIRNQKQKRKLKYIGRSFEFVAAKNESSDWRREEGRFIGGRKEWLNLYELKAFCLRATLLLTPVVFIYSRIELSLMQPFRITIDFKYKYYFVIYTLNIKKTSK